MQTLELFWVVSMLVLGLIFCWCAAITERHGFMMATPCSLTMAVVFAWDNVLSVLFLYMQALLPDHGTELNTFTALVCTALMVVLVMFFILISPFLFMNEDGNIELRNFMAFAQTNKRDAIDV
ncbi:hypothetical protein QTV44_002554 [Vibrio vulnificus]|nr:hypothetical protein [Vibrio vulnificus]